jgi:hypothetical protein
MITTIFYSLLKYSWPHQTNHYALQIGRYGYVGPKRVIAGLQSYASTTEEEMIMLRAKLHTLRSALTILLMAVLAAPAFAELSTRNAELLQVSDQLTDFKRTAFDMRREADTLKSFAPGKRLHWQSHTYILDVLKNHVNEMGKTLEELEAVKPSASEGQTIAIERSRPHLVSVAQNLTKAINLVEEDRNSVYWSEYGEAVSKIDAHAAALHTTIDTVLDYENARLRFHNLEADAVSAGGN